MSDAVAAAFISAVIGGLTSIGVAVVNNLFQNRREAFAKGPVMPQPTSAAPQQPPIPPSPAPPQPNGGTTLTDKQAANRGERRIPYAVLALIAVVVAMFAYPFVQFGSRPAPNIFGLIYVVAYGALPLVVAGMGIRRHEWTGKAAVASAILASAHFVYFLTVLTSLSYDFLSSTALVPIFVISRLLLIAILCWVAFSWKPSPR